MPLRIATGTRDTIASAVANLIGTSGTLKVYTGSQPGTNLPCPRRQRSPMPGPRR